MLKRIAWIFGAVAFFGLYVSYQIILGFLMSTKFMNYGMSLLLVSYGASICLIALLMAYRLKLFDLDFSFIKQRLPLLLICYASVYFVNVLGTIIMHFEGVETASNQAMVESLFSSVPIPVLFVMIVVMAPIMEEILVRGIVPHLIFKRGSILGYIAGTILFAALHQPDSIGAWVVYGGMSIILTTVAYKTKHLEASWLLHTIMNSFSFILLSLMHLF